MVAASEVDHRNVQRLTELYDSRDIEQGIYEEKDERKSKQRIKSLAPACSIKEKEMHILHTIHCTMHKWLRHMPYADCTTDTHCFTHSGWWNFSGVGNENVLKCYFDSERARTTRLIKYIPVLYLENEEAELGRPHMLLTLICLALANSISISLPIWTYMNICSCFIHNFIV